MKKLTKILAIVMCAVVSFGATACSTTPPPGGGGGISNWAPPAGTPTLVMRVSGGGLGTQIYQQEAKRFYEWTVAQGKDYYNNGTKGAWVQVKSTGSGLSTGIDQTVLSEDIHFVSTGTYNSQMNNYAQYLANIDDIVRSTIPGESKTILDKIPQHERWEYSIKDENSTNADKREYYGVPGSGTYAGLSYDKDLFDDNGLYFAKPDVVIGETEREIESSIIYPADDPLYGGLYVMTSVDENKSVGPNGVPGDGDDGLPSSLFELIVLCEQIDNLPGGVAPFTVSEAQSWYINSFADALYASLLGEQNMNAINSFVTGGDGMEIVVGFEDENLFSGVDIGLKKPKAVKVNTNLQTGYYTTWSLDKYYTYAFLALMEKEGWYLNSPETHTTIQKEFILGKKTGVRRSAMLVEQSYWYNESTDVGNFRDWRIESNNAPREIRWMPLPVNIATMVTGETGVANNGFNESTAGEKMVLCETGTGFWGVNKRYEEDKTVMEIVKDYILFCFTNDNLAKAYAQTGFKRIAVETQMNASYYANADSYKKAYFELTKDAVIAYASADNFIYRNTVNYFQRSSNSKFFAEGPEGGTSVRDAITKNKFTPADRVINPLAAFKGKMFNKTDWDGFYSAEYPGGETALTLTYPVGHPKAGQVIVFEN